LFTTDEQSDAVEGPLDLTPESRFSRVAQRCGFVFLFFSAALWIVTTVCFVGVWDHVAAITTFPQWSWATVGILSAAIAWRLLRGRTRSPLALLALWLLATLFFADNVLPVFRGLAHGSAPVTPAPTGAVRVVTLNCASSVLAAGEVMKFRPEIVLLQEIPPSNKVADVAREWFGPAVSVAWGFDCVIISPYTLTPVEDRPPVHYTRAIALLPGDRQILVTSLRLTPPLGRTDLWKPIAWRAYREDRQFRTRQLRSVLEAEPAKPELPQIIGGDFNAPAGDGIYKLLKGYRDSHRAAGRGWGNTALNTIPLFRPDQIWLKRLSALSSHAIQTIHSDHRMVVTDIALDEPH
jgi:endonuclease/exonuclease/phosphatase (EEP) superfamily protein YafD